MKKLFYVLTLLSVSLFMISCGNSDETPPPTPATGITLESLGSLVGDYVVDNYTITVKTAKADGTEIRSTTVSEDNYTLVQGFLSHALITKNGDQLTVTALISNDSILSKVADVTLSADELKSYPSFYNIFVDITGTPTLNGNKLGDVDTINYEIEKLGDKQIKVTYKASKEETATAGVITHSENGYIILTKTSDTATEIPTEIKSLYTTKLINNPAPLEMGPVGRYAISNYVYNKNGAATATITADSASVNEKNLIGGLSVNLLSVDAAEILLGMNISMQTDNATGFGIDANNNGADTDKYIFRALEIDVLPLLPTDGSDMSIPKILEDLGAKIAADGKSMKFTLTDNQDYIKHGLPIVAGDNVTLTLQMMNDGYDADGLFNTFDNKTFFE